MTDQVPTPYDWLANKPPEPGEFGFGQIGATMQRAAYREGYADRDEQARREREAVDALLVAVEKVASAFDMVEAGKGLMGVVEDWERERNWLTNALAAVRAAREA